MLHSKKGVSLSVVLGIMAFLLISGGTLLTYIVQSSSITNTSITTTDNRNYAENVIDATIEILVREKNFDAAFISSLESYMGVTITNVGSDLWKVTHPLKNNQTMSSYVFGASGALTTYDSLFQYTGQEETFHLNPLVTPTILFEAYFRIYMNTNFPSIVVPPEFEDFAAIIAYIRYLALEVPDTFVATARAPFETNPSAGYHWYIQGNVSIAQNKVITVPTGYLLIIDGNLTMAQTTNIVGNVVVNGTVTLNGRGSSVESVDGTLYIRDSFIGSNRIDFGTIDRPAFVFANASIELGNRVTGYAYLLSNTYSSKGGGSFDLTGGIYYLEADSSVPYVAPNEDLSEEDFYDMAIPVTITEDELVEEGSLIITIPRID